MEFTIRHWIPGRIRLQIPALSRKTAMSEQMIAWLGRQNGLRDVRINHDCASLVVSYDEKQRLTLQLLLGWLAGASLAEVKSLIANTASTPLSAPMTPSHAPSGPPQRADARMLALPTVSFGLAFLTNPFAVAVNVPLMLWNAVPIARRA
jgi:hypothetical protein